jgi:hypothetical protein
MEDLFCKGIGIIGASACVIGIYEIITESSIPCLIKIPLCALFGFMGVTSLIFGWLGDL